MSRVQDTVPSSLVREHGNARERRNSVQLLIDEEEETVQVVWPLTPTDEKIADYNAAVGDLVVIDGSAGSVEVFLPDGPSNGAIVGVYCTATAVTIKPSGSDTLAEGTAGVTQSAGVATRLFIYDAARTNWM